MTPLSTSSSSSPSSSSPTIHSKGLRLLLCVLCLSVSVSSWSLPSSWRRLFSTSNIPLRGTKIDEVLMMPMKCERKLPGKVALVGSGPGDPDLLTVQAVRMLKEASLVISDRLVSKEILALVDCELRIAKKRPGCAEEAQEEIYEWTREAVLAGRNVVRLKIGDPFLFGRGGEEVLEFRKLGVEPIIVPGVSSSYAAPLAANIPLTHRGVSNSVLISTGYGREQSVVEIPEYVSDRTVVLLMAVGRIGEIAANMTAMGYPKTTPVAIIERATTPEQRTLIGTLETIDFVAKRDEAKAPSTIIIGEVVNVLRGGDSIVAEEFSLLGSDQKVDGSYNKGVSVGATRGSNPFKDSFHHLGGLLAALPLVGMLQRSS